MGFHAVNRGAVSDNEYVMVNGCGMVGMGAVVGASLRGAIVIAVDLDDEKLTLAREMGASYTINSGTEISMHMCWKLPMDMARTW